MHIQYKGDNGLGVSIPLVRSGTMDGELFLVVTGTLCAIAIVIVI